ncbi:hypothetical protein KL86SPO_31468 [uncultured Sporomusa sp.]|uniref:Uncharacterized protein n=1 Tax=uncultured Sporomusa sp. TaxID=307249 RepID=A0A212LV53_9FIRM|nr:hypothetical protein KL86SPO_31468 [uncultured Sporomusa sp.]
MCVLVGICVLCMQNYEILSYFRTITNLYQYFQNLFLAYA